MGEVGVGERKNTYSIQIHMAEMHIRAQIHRRVYLYTCYYTDTCTIPIHTQKHQPPTYLA